MQLLNNSEKSDKPQVPKIRWVKPDTIAEWLNIYSAMSICMNTVYLNNSLEAPHKMALEDVIGLGIKTFWDLIENRSLIELNGVEVPLSNVTKPSWSHIRLALHSFCEAIREEEEIVNDVTKQFNSGITTDGLLFIVKTMGAMMSEENSVKTDNVLGEILRASV